MLKILIYCVVGFFCLVCVSVNAQILIDANKSDIVEVPKYDVVPMYNIVDTTKVKIEGVVEGLFNSEVRIEKTNDYITGCRTFIKHIVIEKDKTFSFEIVLSELSLLHFTIGRFSYSLWVFPNENYDLTFKRGQIVFNVAEKQKGSDLTRMDAYCNAIKSDLLSSNNLTAERFVDFKKQLVYMNKSNSKIADDYAKYSALLFDLLRINSRNVPSDSIELINYKNTIFDVGAMQYLNKPYVQSFMLYLKIIWTQHPEGFEAGLVQALKGEYVFKNTNTQKWEAIGAIYYAKKTNYNTPDLHILADKKLKYLKETSTNMFMTKTLNSL